MRIPSAGDIPLQLCALPCCHMKGFLLISPLLMFPAAKPDQQNQADVAAEHVQAVDPELVPEGELCT